MARTISNQVGILTLGRLLAYAVMFFVPLINVRALSKTDYGFYRQYWLIFETVSGLLIMAYPNSLLYFFPRSDDIKRKTVYLAQTLVFLVAMGILSWFVYGVLRAATGGGLGGVIKDFFWPLCLFTFFMMVSAAMDRLFVAEKQVERQSIYHALTSILQASIVIILSWYTHRVDLIIYGLLVFSFLKFAFTATYTVRAYRPSLKNVTTDSFQEQLSYALPLGLAATVLILITKTDKFIITHFMGREMFAVYSIGAFQVPVVDIVRSSISNVTFPLMARYQKEGNYGEILNLWQRQTLKTAVLFFPLFVFLEVSARPFFTVLFTREYEAAVPIFMIYILLFVRATVETGAILMIFKRNAFLLKTNIVVFVVNLALSILLYRTMGWLGVPLATVIVIYLQTVLYLVYGARLLDTPLKRVMPWADLTKRLFVALVPGALLMIGYRFIFVDNIIELAASAAAYFAVYFVICASLGYLNWADIRAVFGGVGR